MAGEGWLTLKTRTWQLGADWPLKQGHDRWEWLTLKTRAWQVRADWTLKHGHVRWEKVVWPRGGLKETKMFLPHPLVKLSIVGRLCDREVACSASDFRVWILNPVSGGQCHLTHLTILRRFSWLAQFSLYVHKSGPKPDSFHLCDQGLWNEQANARTSQPTSQPAI